MEQVYVLELAGGRYYIGKTTDVVKRVKEHASGKGAGYTQLYKPKKLVEVRTMKSQHDENTLTREYMAKYGVDNVRGGAYAQIALPRATEELLKQEFRAASDACFTCGKHGHFASACPKKQKEEEEEDVVWCCSYCSREFATEASASAHEGGCKFRKLAAMAGRQKLMERKSGGGGACYRCGRTSHYANECYANTHRKGYALDSDDSEDSIGL